MSPVARVAMGLAVAGLVVLARVLITEALVRWNPEDGYAQADTKEKASG